MADKSLIGWTDATWNCLYGCSRVSPGCEHCYAESHCHRFSGPGQMHEGLTVLRRKGPVWTGKIDLAYHRLFEPLKWQRPRRIFVNSLSDVFHEGVPFEYVKAMFGVMAAADRHTFQLLTKREERMPLFFAEMASRGQQGALWECLYWASKAATQLHAEGKLTNGELRRYLNKLEWKAADHNARWPLPNVWLGVSAENEEMLQKRVPELFKCDAAVRWVSAEPLLSDLPGLRGFLERNGSGVRLDWVVAGGESGRSQRVRKMELEWATRARDACADAGVAFMLKQLGTKLARQYPGSGKKGTNKEAWPIELRVCDYPQLRAA